MARPPVMAHWQFELEDGAEQWRGFSPPVSGSLEVAYQQWIADPLRGGANPAKIRSGNFTYGVEFASMAEVGLNAAAQKPQRIRRISVSEAEPAQRCTVDPSLWRDLQAGHLGEAQEAHLRARRLEEDLNELRRRCRELQEEVSRLQGELAPFKLAGESLATLLAAILPGRLVLVEEGWENLTEPYGVPAKAVGRVRAVEGSAAAVGFPGAAGRRGLWLPCACLAVAWESELMSRPGTRVRWQAPLLGAPRYGVVCGLAGDDALLLRVEVLQADGSREIHLLQDLQLDAAPRPAGSPPGLGDLVRARPPAGALPPGGLVGMVLRVRAGQEVPAAAARVETCVVRFRSQPECHDCKSDVDCQHDFEVPLSSVERDSAADRVRPGAAVRFKDGLPVPRIAGQSEIGVVYATHGDGTAVVDFLNNLGSRCNAALLEVVEAPGTADHAALRLLSEYLSRHEILAQYGEDRVEAMPLGRAAYQRPAYGTHCGRADEQR